VFPSQTRRPLDRKRHTLHHLDRLRYHFRSYPVSYD
jgi:hypothetical protein